MTWSLQNPANTRLRPDKQSLRGSRGLESSSWSQSLERHNDETRKGHSSGQHTGFSHARICRLVGARWCRSASAVCRSLSHAVNFESQNVLPRQTAARCGTEESGKELRGYIESSCKFSPSGIVHAHFLPRPAQENGVLKFPDLKEEDNT